MIDRLRERDRYISPNASWGTYLHSCYVFFIPFRVDIDYL